MRPLQQLLLGFLLLRAAQLGRCYSTQHQARGAESNGAGISVHASSLGDAHDEAHAVGASWQQPSNTDSLMASQHHGFTAPDDLTDEEMAHWTRMLMQVCNHESAWLPACP